MKLGEVMKLSKGNLIDIENDVEYTIAGVQNYGAGIVNRRRVKGIELTMKKYQLIKPNQLMWCKVDTKNGAFGITKLEHANSLASTNMALADIDTSKCHPEFIEYLFRISFFHEIITKASSGTTNRKYLTPTQLFETIEIPDFDKDEQLKWLNKVDSIINSGITTELTHQLTLVKKLRQQLLQDAVQGKLLEQNKSRKDSGETGSELLKKIKAEKAKLIAEGKLKKEKPLPPIKPEEIPFEIPENWVWCRLGEIALNISTGPFGTMLHKSDYVSNGIPLVNPMNIVNEKIVASDKMMINEKTKARLKSYVLNAGDIVIGRRGEMGRCAVVTESESGWICGTGSFFLRLHDEIYRPYFIKVLGAEFAKSILLGASVGSTMNNLNHKILSNLPIPLSPLTEQTLIVQRLDELIHNCNELEESIKESQEQNEKLLQQVLREALSK